MAALKCHLSAAVLLTPPHARCQLESGSRSNQRPEGRGLLERFAPPRRAGRALSKFHKPDSCRFS
jgi:hypothetical protein